MTNSTKTIREEISMQQAEKDGRLKELFMAAKYSGEGQMVVWDEDKWIEAMKDFIEREREEARQEVYDEWWEEKRKRLEGFWKDLGIKRNEYKTIREKVDALFNTPEIMRAGRTKEDIVVLIDQEKKEVIEKVGSVYKKHEDCMNGQCNLNDDLKELLASLEREEK